MLYVDANDDTENNLQKANLNYLQLNHRWCECTHTDDIANSVYYRSSYNGNHGWMCPSCYRIVQTG